MGFHDSHVSLVVCAVCEKIKFRSKTNVKMKVSHSVVAVGIVAGGWGGFMSCHTTHDTNFCNFVDLLSFTIPNKA